MRLHLVTPASASLRKLASFLTGYADHFDFLHVRRPYHTEWELRLEVEFLLRQGFPRQKMILHDHPQWVQAYQLFAAQLGKRSEPISIVRARYPGLRLGASIHSAAEAQEHGKDADWFLLGTLFSTQSKPGIRPLGLAGARPIIQQARKPVVLIGGIQPSQLPDIAASGASGVAVMSGILGARDPEKALQEYLRHRGETHG